MEAKAIGKMPIQNLEAISKPTKEPLIHKTKESHHRYHLNNTIEIFPIGMSKEDNTVCKIRSNHSISAVEEEGGGLIEVEDVVAAEEEK